MAAGAPAIPAEPEPSLLAGLNATRRLARQTLTYAVSGVIGPAIAVLTLPVFARVFTQAEYGVLELGTTLTTLALTVTDLGLLAAAQRSFFDYGRDAQDERHRCPHNRLRDNVAPHAGDRVGALPEPGIGLGVALRP